MCGIAGIYHFGSSRPVDAEALGRMSGLLSHRGPDEAGLRVDGPVGLAMRRLSIIDLSTGRQPMTNEDESLWIVFNGEIYNFQELRAELQAKGHPFKTHSDTEVILHLYEEMGPDCVKRLRGMFAFSLWDKVRSRLMLARDRIGKKPLVYALGEGRLAWSSEIQSLLALPDVPRELDPAALDLYLSLQYIPSPRTIYKSIRKLPPAHRLICEKGRVRVERYWDLPLDAAAHRLSLPEAKEALREKLREAVRLRMIADVPLGAFLSGGVDSTCVVGMMSSLSDRPVKTFSIGFEEEAFSELPFAREAARRFGTEHTEFVVKPEMSETLPMLARHYGEPYADSSALPTYYVAREARRHVTVALNGDGGDENFAGYRRYAAMKAARFWDALPETLRRTALRAAGRWAEGASDSPLRHRARRLLAVAGRGEPAQRYIELIGYFSPEDKRAMYTRGFQSALAGEPDPAAALMAGLFEEARGLDDVNRLLFVDFRTYLPDCLMTKVDIATMAASLEGRSPLLDHELIEWAFRLPGDWKLKGFSGMKWILKEAMRDFLPPSIHRRGKMGFGIPLGPWFRGRLKEYWRDAVLSSEALSRGYFEEAFLRRLFEEHVSGRRNHGYRLWALLMLELWHKTCAPEGGLR